jgi:hypothetical protein
MYVGTWLPQCYTDALDYMHMPALSRHTAEARKGTVRETFLVVVVRARASVCVYVCVCEYVCVREYVSM